MEEAREGGRGEEREKERRKVCIYCGGVTTYIHTWGVGVFWIAWRYGTFFCMMFSYGKGP